MKLSHRLTLAALFSAVFAAAAPHDVSKLRRPLLDKARSHEIALSEDEATRLLDQASSDDAAYGKVVALLSGKAAAQVPNPVKKARQIGGLADLGGAAADPQQTAALFDGGAKTGGPQLIRASAALTPAPQQQTRCTPGDPNCGGSSAGQSQGTQSDCTPGVDEDCTPASGNQGGTRCTPGDPGCGSGSDGGSGNGSTPDGSSGNRGGAIGGQPLPPNYYPMPTTTPDWDSSIRYQDYDITILHTGPWHYYDEDYGNWEWPDQTGFVTRDGSDTSGGERSYSIKFESQQRRVKYDYYWAYYCAQVDVYQNNSSLCRHWVIIHGRATNGYDYGKTHALTVEVKLFNDTKLYPFESERFDLSFDGEEKTVKLSQTRAAHHYDQQDPQYNGHGYAYINLVAHGHKPQAPSANGLALRLELSNDKSAFKVKVDDKWAKYYDSEPQLDFVIKDANSGTTVFGTSGNFQQVQGGEIDLSGWQPWENLHAGQYRLTYSFRRLGGKASTEDAVGPLSLDNTSFNPAVYGQIKSPSILTFRNQTGRAVTISYFVKTSGWFTDNLSGSVTLNAGESKDVPVVDKKGKTQSAKSLEFGYK